MANKYSRFQFQPYVSGYVDPASVDTAKVLRERYDRSRQSYDLVDRVLDHASDNVLNPFELTHINEAKSHIRGILGDVATKGDYENAELKILDATNYLQGHKGLQSAFTSKKNRDLELDYISKAKLQGNIILDFGRDKIQNHRSYYYDDESGEYITNIYRPQGELMHNYDKKMRELIVSSAGITGTKSADALASDLLETYLYSDSGDQDFRNLVLLEYDKSMPYEDRVRMAKNDIYHRLREKTRQFVDGLATHNSDGRQLIPGVREKNEFSIGGESDSVEDNILEYLLDNQQGNNASIKFNKAVWNENEQKFILQFNDEELTKNYYGIKNIVQNNPNWNEETGDLIFKRLLLMTMPKQHTNIKMGEVVTAGGQPALEYGEVGLGGSLSLQALATTGRFFGLTKKILPKRFVIGTTILSAGIGAFRGITDEFIDQTSAKGNVRGWSRPGGDEDAGLFEKAWDVIWPNEKQTLNRQIDDVDWWNKQLNLKDNDKLTSDDMSEIQKYGRVLHNFMITKTSSGNTGDDFLNSFNNNSWVVNQGGFTFDESKAGNDLRTPFNKGMRDFTIHPTETFTWPGLTGKLDKKGQLTGDWKSFFGKDFEHWKKDANIVSVHPGDAANNISTKVVIEVNGILQTAEVKLDQNGMPPPFLQSLAKIFNRSSIIIQPILSAKINNEEKSRAYKRTQGQNAPPVTFGEFVTWHSELMYPNDKNKQKNTAANMILDMTQRRIYESFKDLPNMFIEKDGKPMLVVPGENPVPWFDEFGGVDNRAWMRFTDMYSTIVSDLYKKQYGTSLSDIMGVNYAK